VFDRDHSSSYSVLVEDEHDNEDDFPEKPSVYLV
jgi:hypothetical protein